MSKRAPDDTTFGITIIAFFLGGLAGALLGFGTGLIFLTVPQAIGTGLLSTFFGAFGLATLAYKYVR